MITDQSNPIWGEGGSDSLWRLQAIGIAYKRQHRCGKLFFCVREETKQKKTKPKEKQTKQQQQTNNECNKTKKKEQDSQEVKRSLACTQIIMYRAKERHCGRQRDYEYT